MKQRRAIFLVLILVCALFLPSCAKQEPPLALRAGQEGFLSEKEGAYFFSQKQKALKLAGDFTASFLSQDEKHMVAINSKKELVVAESGKTGDIVDREISSILSVNNQCVYYQSALKGVRRYRFSDKKVTMVGYAKKYTLSADYSSALILSDDLELISLCKDAPEPTVIPYEGDRSALQPLGISNDGTAVCFTAMDPSGKRAFYYSSEGENELLGTVDTKKLKETTLSFSPDGSELILAAEDTDFLFIREKGGEIRKIELDGKIGSTIFSDHGSLEEAFSLSPLYFTLENSKGVRSLYRLDDKGNQEKLLTDVTQWELRGDKVYYRSKAFELSVATLKDGKVDHIDMICDESMFFQATLDGSAVFYYSLSDSDSLFVGDLYCAQYGSAPVRLARDCNFLTLKLSTDSKHYAFSANAVVLDSMGLSTSGDLYYGKIGEAPEKIDSNAIDLFGQYENSHFFTKNFCYLKRVSTDEDWAICTLNYFNGKQARQLASDINHKIF